MENQKSICQSCGMPMEKEDDFGTEAGGKKSEEYCRFCRKDGAFTDEGVTMVDKIKKNIAIAKQMGMSEEGATSLANKTIPGLKRWNK
jgi:hypothetical protein